MTSVCTAEINKMLSKEEIIFISFLKVEKGYGADKILNEKLANCLR